MKYTILKPEIGNFKNKIIFITLSLFITIILLGYASYQFLNNIFDPYLLAIVSILSITNIILMFSIHKEKEQLKKNKDNVIEIELDVDLEEEKYESETEKKLKQINLMSFSVFVIMFFIIILYSPSETLNKNLIISWFLWLSYSAVKSSVKNSIIKKDKFEKRREFARKIIEDTLEIYSHKNKK